MIVYRTSGPWGAGNGANLTAAQIDGNFADLDGRVVELEDNPPEAISIHHFTVEGSLLTIIMTDGSEHGPFVLPLAQWRFTGDWTAGTTYFVGDIFLETGSLYFVRVQHVSDTEFDPALFTEDGYIYQLMVPRQTYVYDITFFHSGTIDSGGEVLYQYVASRDFTIEEGMGGAQAYVRVAATGDLCQVPIYLNWTIIGYITFTPSIDTDANGGQYGTVAGLESPSGDDVEVVAGDILAFGRPLSGSDLVAADLSFTLPVSVPGLS